MEEFQSTPPARGATGHRVVPVIVRGISIHAPREGGDIPMIPMAPFDKIFQSTPPARGATETYSKCALWLEISIHAPREGGDRPVF